MVFPDAVKIAKAKLLIDHLNSISSTELKKVEQKISGNFLQICIRNLNQCRQRKKPPLAKSLLPVNL